MLTFDWQMAQCFLCSFEDDVQPFFSTLDNGHAADDQNLPNQIYSNSKMVFISNINKIYKLYEMFILCVADPNLFRPDSDPTY